MWDRNGDSLRAELNGTYINVTVGLGNSPEQAGGILLNANGNINEIAARDSAVLTALPADINYPWDTSTGKTICTNRTDVGGGFAQIYLQDARYFRSIEPREGNLRRKTDISTRSKVSRYVAGRADQGTPFCRHTPQGSKPLLSNVPSAL